jgi:hypothetical protein
MKKKLWICCLALALLAILGGMVVLGINGYVVLSTKDRILQPEEVTVPDADCILVLGCRVYEDGTPSHMLEDRLRRGVELYEGAAAPKLLMSAPDMVRVTIAVEGLTSAMKSATASTATTTPTISFLVESQLDSTAAAWLARRTGAFLDLCAFDAVFDLRFWAMDP